MNKYCVEIKYLVEVEACDEDTSVDIALEWLEYAAQRGSRSLNITVKEKKDE